MRRILSACALAAALAVPAAALAGQRNDGTLSVKNGMGSVGVVARGALLGHCDRCTVVIDDPNPNDGSVSVVPLFTESRQLSDTKTSWSGNDLRFRVVGGFFRVRIVGNGIDVSAVTTAGGLAVLDGQGFSAGTYSIGGGPYVPMPILRAVVQFGS